METAPFTSIAFFDWIENFFVQHSVAGMLRLYPQAMYLILVFGIIDLCTTWSLYDGELRMSRVISRVMKVGFFVLLVVNWRYLSHIILETFSKAGGIAAGLDVTTESLLKPSGIMQIGFKITSELSNKLKDLGITQLPSIVMYYTGIAATYVSFFIMAMQLLLTVIEFHIFSSLGIILLPFGSLRFTSFLFQRVISAVFSFAIKLMMTYFMLGLISSQLKAIPVIAAGDFASILQAVSVNMVLAYLLFKIPALAASMISGQPSMDGAAFAKGAITGAAAVASGGVSKVGAAAKGAANLYGSGSAALAAAKVADGSDTKMGLAKNFAKEGAKSYLANSTIAKAVLQGANNTLAGKKNFDRFKNGSWKTKAEDNRNQY